MACESVHTVARIKMDLLSHPQHDIHVTARGLFTTVYVSLPPFSYPDGTPSAHRAVCEIKPSCNWQFTPKEGVRGGGKKLSCFSGVFIKKACVSFGRKIVLWKVP